MVWLYDMEECLRVEVWRLGNFSFIVWLEFGIMGQDRLHGF
jgi:hypothetical protein